MIKSLIFAFHPLGTNKVLDTVEDEEELKPEAITLWLPNSGT